jgi:hypothetical protein
MENRIVIILRELDVFLYTDHSCMGDQGTEIYKVLNVPKGIDVQKLRIQVRENIVNTIKERECYKAVVIKKVREFYNITKGRTSNHLIQEYLSLNKIEPWRIEAHGSVLSIEFILVEKLKELGAKEINYEEVEV